MEGSLMIDINFNDKISNEHIIVTETPVFDFFCVRSYVSKSHYPFLIKTLRGPYQLYKRDNLDPNDNISVGFVFPKGDERPFALILQKSDGKKMYYKVTSFRFIRWAEIDELNGIEEEMQNKLLLDVYKKIFTHFFDSTLRVSEDVLSTRLYGYYETKYDIVSQIHYCEGYDRYHYVQDKAHSVSVIYINDNVASFDKDIKFVKDFFFYYTYHDKTTPLLIETFDYKFDDDIPLYNYFVKESISGDQWISVECGTNLVDPKCKSDIKRLLDLVKNTYKMNRVIMEIANTNEQLSQPITKIIDDSPFIFDIRKDKYYTQHSYQPIVSGMFLLDYITINQVKQVMDTHSLQIGVLYVLYTNEDPNRPVLICLAMYNHFTSYTSQYYWYKLEKPNSNVWTRIDFNANPDKDILTIEDKIKELFESRFNFSGLYLPLKWIGVFGLGCVLGTYIGVRFSRRIILSTIRLYRRLRGYQRL